MDVLEIMLQTLTSLQGLIVIGASIIITTLGCMCKSEGEHSLGNDLINGGLAIVPCFFTLVFILGIRYNF